MKKQAAIMAALGPMFNRLLGIQPGHFGSTARRKEPSPANLRAADLVRRRAQAHENRLGGKPYEKGV
jgi:hypothetical protein